MEDRIVRELHEAELSLRSAGFSQSVIDAAMQAFEAESFSITDEERLDNYFRFLKNKIGVIREMFVEKRKNQVLNPDSARFWESRASFQKSRLEKVMPNTELSRALGFLIDKSLEL